MSEPQRIGVPTLVRIVAWENLGSAQRRVRALKHQGTGVLVSVDGSVLVATAGHVLDKMFEAAGCGCEVTATCERPVTGEVINLDLSTMEVAGSVGDVDLGAIVLTARDATRVGPVAADSTLGRASAVANGDEVLVLGYPERWAPRRLSARTLVLRPCDRDPHEYPEERDSTLFVHIAWPHSAAPVPAGADTVERTTAAGFPLSGGVSGGPMLVAERVVAIVITENYGHDASHAHEHECGHCVIGVPIERWLAWASDRGATRRQVGIPPSAAPDAADEGRCIDL